jgi:O-antigen/teichoic acid export membrane protein
LRLGYGRAAVVTGAGVGLTGLVTYAYFSIASRSLDDARYGHLTLLWSAVFLTVSVLYRPVEQLIARTTAENSARGISDWRYLRVAAAIQVGLVALALAVGLALRGRLEEGLLGGEEAFYWVMVVSVPAYAVSYFTRGVLAGLGHFRRYGGLMLAESAVRCLFALAVAVGFASGHVAVALGIAAAPLASLVIVPAIALTRRRSPGEAATTAPGQRALTIGRGAGFTASVLLITLSEQAFLNAGPLLINATTARAGAELAGFAFNILLIARAPLQLFQAVQASILPYLSFLRARGETDRFRASVHATLAGIAAFATLVALAMLVAGSAVMRLLFGAGPAYGDPGLALIALGTGAYLCGSTLSQAALAGRRAGRASLAWMISAAVFTTAVALPRPEDVILRLEVAFTVSACMLALLLHRLLPRGERTRASGVGIAEAVSTEKVFEQ